MLTQLTTVKSRLAIASPDYDDILTHAIQGVSARFDRECNRSLARTVDATYEFETEDIELSPLCYPIESVARFELKTSETDGWIEQSAIDFLIRNQSVISLLAPLSPDRSPALGRVTYTGGYLLPADADVASATRLPDDLEQAAVEQVAAWFQHRDRLGLVRSWPHDGTFEAFAQLELLLEVKTLLRKYQRWIV